MMSVRGENEAATAEIVAGIRLQPLMLAANNLLVAHEVLISLADRQNPERFFSRLTSDDTLAIFFWQAETVLQRSGTYFLNLPVSVLCDPHAIEPLLAFAHENRLVIELQDPENALTLDEKSKQNLIWNIWRLRKYGWMIWLDDWKASFHRFYRDAGIVFDGIKLDRSLASSRQLARLIKMARQLALFVLVEGIETEALLEHAVLSGADLGQGFLWPESGIKNMPKTPLTQYVDKYCSGSKKPACIYIDVCCSVPDHYLKIGLIGLMEKALAGLADNHIWRIRETQERTQADIIISECQPGEVPYSEACYNENTPLIAETKCTLRIVRDAPIQKWVACSRNAAVLYRKANMDTTIKGMASLLRCFLHPREKYSPACNDRCTYCTSYRLSLREREALMRFGLGQTVSLMAQNMQCSPKTISGYKRRLMTKLRLFRHNEFYSYAQRVADKNDKTTSRQAFK